MDAIYWIIQIQHMMCIKAETLDLFIELYKFDTRYVLKLRPEWMLFIELYKFDTRCTLKLRHWTYLMNYTNSTQDMH